MLYLFSASLYVGRKVLLNEVNFAINPGDKIGVTGRNGSGKSHLLELLSGSISPDAGEISLTRSKRVLLVKQELPDDDLTPLEYIRSHDLDVQKLEADIQEHEESNNYAILETLYGDLAQIEEDRYDYTEDEASSVNSLAPKVLIGLGLSRHELSQPMRNLSGGLRMRISLAKALVYTPDILLLDEPTNHLDYESTKWLIAFLNNYPARAAFVIVTHDVKLLEEVCTTTAILRAGALSVFGGSYHEYREHLSTSEKQDEIKNTDLERRAERNMQMYHKFKDLPKARAAQAVTLRKRAEKLREQIVEIPTEEPVITLEFAEHDVVDDPMIQGTNLILGYGGNVVLSIPELSIQYGNKIGLLGRNGQGKSTIARFFANKMEALSGDVTRKARLKVGYYSQELTEELNSEMSVYQQFSEKTAITNEAEIRSNLSRYGFTHDKIMTKIENLSGGEKAKLLFALICFQTPNLIILDEPTNHLDIETRDELIKAIQVFPGTIVIISHDSDLLAKTVDQYWLVKDGTIHVRPKEIRDYQRNLDLFIAMNIQTPIAKATAKVSSRTSSEATELRVKNGGALSKPSDAGYFKQDKKKDEYLGSQPKDSKKSALMRK